MARITPRFQLDEQLYRAIFDYSIDGAMITVPDGRILAANPAACAIFRASEEEICRRGRQGFSDESDPRWGPALEERRRTGRVEAVVPMVRADGAPFFAEVSSAVFAGESGEARTCVIFRDVTERIRLEQQLRAATEITHALLAGDTIEQVLTAVARFARELADASEAGVVTAGNEPAGVVVTAADGLRMPELVGSWYPAGSFLATVMASRRSTIVDDLTAVATQEDGRNLGLGPAMIVPIVGGDTVFGNLVVGSNPGHRKYGADELVAIEMLAQSAGIALTLAQARAEAERAALMDNQSRIAADLHDSALQQLFALGLGLQAVSSLAPTIVAERISESVARLEDVIKEIRRTIFGLYNSELRGDLVREIKATVDEYAEHLGFSPTIQTSGSLDECDRPTSRHLVLVLREALSNVLRHARATRVDITVSHSGSELVLKIVDNGSGPSPGRSGGNGLKNMDRRALALGGKFQLTPLSPQGTCLEWRVPVTPADDPPEP